MLSTGIIFSSLCGVMSNNRASAHFVDKDYENMRRAIIERASKEKVQEILAFVDVIKEQLDMFINNGYPRTDLWCAIVVVVANELFPLLGWNPSDTSDIITISKKEIYNKYKGMTDLLPHDYSRVKSSIYVSQFLIVYILSIILFNVIEIEESSTCADHLIQLFEISDFDRCVELFECLLELIEAEYNVGINEWEKDVPELELKHWSDSK